MLKKGPVADGIRDVTFVLDGPVSGSTVHLCGEFNEWSEESLPLKQAEDGHFEVTVPLRAGERYRYRYPIDGTRWENDFAADDYVSNEFGGEDSAVDA